MTDPRLSVALVNQKAGVGKTTSGVLLALALHHQGHEVLLGDADPGESALTWAERVNMPFDTVGLPRTNTGTRLGSYCTPDMVAVVDTPQAETHGRTVRSLLRVVDEAIICVSPSVIEVERTSGMATHLAEVAEHRDTPLRVSVLLNRVIAHTISAREVRAALTDEGYHVLTTEIPMAQRYVKVYGQMPTDDVLGPIRDVSAEILDRAGIQ
ncbi:AAA family ATPase [Nocardiopsis sp. NPDC006938]|uniref:nucleotide-binding protein n=1 Tax=Nocardiopsis sp. NPDC006938 TaxID=3364337 RepID=UPI0036BB9124